MTAPKIGAQALPLAADLGQRINALATRCEVEEPSAELDAAIESATRGLLARTTFPPPYTTSLDAAVTLVPEGWLAGLTETETHWLVALRTIDGERHVDGVADTEEMARCAAALRARAALPKGK